MDIKINCNVKNDYLIFNIQYLLVKQIKYIKYIEKSKIIFC